MAAKTALATARMSHMLKTYNGMEAKRSPKRKRPIVIDWVFLFLVAVTVGFEPTVDFHPHNFSRVAPSAARTRHREIGYYIGGTHEY